MKTSSLNKKRIVLIIFVVIMVPIVMCVSLALFGPRLGRIIRQSLWKNDSIKSAEIAHSMVDYTLPNGYLEKSYIQVFGNNLVLLGSEDPDTGMTIQIMQESISMNDQELVSAMEEAWAKEIGNHTYQTKPTNTEILKLLGEDTILSYREGKDETGQEVRQLVTVFYGKTGWTVLIIVSPLEYWDQNLVNDFLRSLK